MMHLVLQAEYEAEGIDWSYIEFVDNQDVLDLIEGRLGLVDLLDEQCRFPTATHKVGSEGEQGIAHMQQEWLGCSVQSDFCIFFLTKPS